MTTYHHKVEQVRTKVSTACSLNGDDHEECIEAWETLEVLEKIDESVYEVMVESLDRYCTNYPDAQECRIIPG
jgi:hypothetical protein